MRIALIVFVCLMFTPLMSQRCIQRCRFRGRYVCGDNGVTYPSRCHARCDGERQFTEGKCSGPCDCYDIYSPVCGIDGITYTNACQARCQGATIVPGSNGPCRCNCSSYYEPVCGNNQVTYQNVCVAGCYNIGVLYFGQCEEFPAVYRYPALEYERSYNPIQRPFRFMDQLIQIQIFNFKQIIFFYEVFKILKFINIYFFLTLNQTIIHLI